jgi:hypothetical protein
MLAVMLEQQRQHKRLEGEVAVVKEDLNGLRNIIGQGPQNWTVAAWIENKGYEAETEVYKNEGGECRKICQAMGIAISADYPKKICNGGVHAARMWPIKVIERWWPECCRRHGWNVAGNQR